VGAVTTFARLDTARLQRSRYRFASQLAQLGLHLHDAARVVSHLLKFGDIDLELTFARPVAFRSTQANAYYWGIVVAAISEHTGYEAHETHELLKQLFLPKPIYLRDGGGDVIAKVVISQTTTTLTTKDFYEYVEKIRRFAATTLNVYIPDPNEPLPADESGAAYPRAVAS